MSAAARIPPAESERSRWSRLIDDPSPLVKQTPTLLAVVAALVLVLTIPGLRFSSVPIALTGVGIVVLATIAAAAFSRGGADDGGWTLIVPMVDILALGLFRAGTGGTESLFSALVLLPVVWLAANPGRWHVVVVGALTSIAMLMPYFATPPSNAVHWLRGVITPLVFAGVAAVVNELSRQHRLQLHRAEQLVVQQTLALHENQEMVAQLRESERRYRGLLDSFESLWASTTGQAVVATDREGMVVAWNPGARRLLGLTEDEALDGVRVDRFLPGRTLAAIMADNPEHATVDGRPRGGVATLFAMADAGTDVDGGFEVVTASGSAFPARVTVTPRRDGAGERIGYLLVISDETRTAEIARMKDEFVGMISHELRTPLSSIVGFLDLLQSDPEHPLTEEQLGFVEVIDRNAQRLLKLVGDLLFTAQVESGRFPIERAETDLCAVVRSAVASAGPHAAREGIELREVVPDEPVRLAADAGRVGQALDNLLSNALKFTPRGGVVTVDLERGEDGISVLVRDTGMGIPADEQKKLFTRFFRASTATRNAVPGVGLGLTITRAIVHAHGGEMSVHSEEGVGTEFRILLPAPVLAA